MNVLCHFRQGAKVGGKGELHCLDESGASAEQECNEKLEGGGTRVLAPLTMSHPLSQRSHRTETPQNVLFSPVPAIPSNDLD